MAKEREYIKTLSLLNFEIGQSHWTTYEHLDALYLSHNTTMDNLAPYVKHLKSAYNHDLTKIDRARILYELAPLRPYCADKST
jgi:hypothetical protein